MSNCLCLACDRANSITTKFCTQCGAKLQIQERYRALKVIGQGGFGKTFLAQDESKPSQPRCVIKQFAFETINPNASQGTLDVAIRLFEQEAKRLDDLGKHPQIPELLSFTIHEGKQYLIQEFIDGETLEQELARVGAFSEQQVRDVLVEVLQILEFVHSKSVIHRDISPDNIIRRRSDNKLVLVDFGAAKHATATLLAKTGTGIGKPSYGAPEQMLGKSVFQSDLFGLGVTCLHLLTNVEPFTLYDVLENEYQWRQFLNGKLVSNEFGKLLDRLIAQKVKDRPKSALDVLQKLGIAQKEIKKNGLTNLKNRFTTSIHKYSGSMRSNRGDYQGALDDYSEIIRLNPNNLSAYYDRGNVKNKLGDSQGAIDDYSKVISLNPNNSFAYYERGNMQNKLGNYKGALDDYSKAIRLNPNDSSAYNERKQLRNKLGDSQGALDDYTEVIIFNPNNFSAYYDRGSLKNSLGDSQGALDDYGEAIRLDPHNASAYYDRAEIRSNLSDYKGALNDYTSAISFNHQIDHSYYYAYYKRGNIKYKLGDKQGALSDYDTAIIIGLRSSDVYCHRGNIMYDLEDYQKALIDYSESIAIDNKNFLAYHNRGNTKYALEDYKGALIDYNAAIRIDSDSASTYFNRGLAKQYLEDYQGALSDHNAAIKLQPNDASFYCCRGLTKHKLRNYQGALDDYNKAIKIDPKYASAYNNRGITKAALGDRKGALEDQKKAVKLDPNFKNYVDLGFSWVVNALNEL